MERPALDSLVVYPPRVVETSHIPLGPEHLELAQQLADHSHAQWVHSLQALGWQYGGQFSATYRTHPHLRPFADLPEAVQEERLQIYLDNLKLALALGYQLGRPERTPHPAAPPTHPAPSTAELPLNLNALLALRRELLGMQPRSPDLYSVFGDHLLKVGEPLLAYDVLNEGLKHEPEHLRLQQLLALALARSGASMAANQLLQRLLLVDPEDEQTLGLLARTDKDLWRQSQDPKTQAWHLQQAAERYLRAYELSNSLWTGINAATMALLRGKTEQAHGVAQALLTQGQAKLQREQAEGKDPYWTLATLAEAELVLGHWQAAERYYTEAVEQGQGRFGDLSSSYRNAALLVQHYGESTERLNQWFSLTRVVVFCGHRIDPPERTPARFPPAVEPKVYEAIKARLRAVRGRVGYASAACGSDILFLEAILALQGECTIVLPYDRDTFVSEVVAAGGPQWVGRFNQVMAQAREVVIASDSKPPDSATSYEYSNRLLHGLAQIRARQLHTELIPLAVWNGMAGDGPGSTASTVSYWRQWSPRVEVIDMAGIVQQAGITPIPAALDEEPVSWMGDPRYQREIRSLMFADVAHYTELTDEQLFAFSRRFLRAVANLTRAEESQPLMRNTWGDALYYVFETVRRAGLFALALSDLMAETQWGAVGLPDDLNVRIALHAGPVFRSQDPVTGQVNYIGTHVNHAARIEPVTPPGKVYASQAFAAIAASEGIQEFTCDYVGQMPWAKQYGTFPTFYVHRTH